MLEPEDGTSGLKEVMAKSVGAQAFAASGDNNSKAEASMIFMGTVPFVGEADVVRHTHGGILAKIFSFFLQISVFTRAPRRAR